MACTPFLISCLGSCDSTAAQLSLHAGLHIHLCIQCVCMYVYTHYIYIYIYIHGTFLKVQEIALGRTMAGVPL